MQLDKIIANPNVDWNLRVNIMKSVIYQAVVSNNDSVRMSNLFRKALALPQQNIDMAELCVRYMVSVDSPVDSVKPILRQILRIDPENSNARNQLLSYAINEQDTASIVDICQTAVDFSSDNLIYYYYLTIARFQQGDKEKALEAATKGLKYTQNEKNINLIVGIFSLAADLNHAVGNDDVAFQLYDSCLLYNPDDDLALNNYAYYLSLKKMNLNKAEDMSRKAIDRNPDNSTYLDTYAWVLFVKRRYREAREYIDKAIERMEKSGEEKDLDANIYDHAGDIYFKNNSFDKAFSLWEKASQLDPSMEKTKMKLKLKRYVE
jgi:tetratricopeptide (TPR) repeat protein